MNSKNGVPGATEFPGTYLVNLWRGNFGRSPYPMMGKAPLFSNPESPAEIRTAVSKTKHDTRKKAGHTMENPTPPMTLEQVEKLIELLDEHGINANYGTRGNGEPDWLAPDENGFVSQYILSWGDPDEWPEILVLTETLEVTWCPVNHGVELTPVYCKVDPSDLEKSAADIAKISQAFENNRISLRTPLGEKDAQQVLAGLPTRKRSDDYFLGSDDEDEDD